MFGARHYDRRRIMLDAQRAEKARRLRRAVRLYRRVLAAEPRAYEIHRRIAPLLAERGESRAAWRSYRHVAEGLIRERELVDASRLLEDATVRIPSEAGAWAMRASTLARRGRTPEARHVLLEGRSHCRGRKGRRHAIALLTRALKLAPGDLTTAVDLAECLCRTRRRSDALRVLAAVEVDACPPDTALRILAVRARARPNIGNVWRWLCARRSAPAPALGSRPALP